MNQEAIDNPASTEQEEAHRLWDQFKASGDPLARLQLIDKHMGLVKSLASKQFFSNSEASLEFDDYVHFGLLGLMDAIEKFDNHRDTAFSTYATYRITGEIINGLSKATEKRQQYAFYRQKTGDQLEMDYQALANLPSDQLFEQMVKYTITQAIDYLLRTPPAQSTDTAYYHPESQDEDILTHYSNKIQEVIKQLDDQEQLVIRYHYYHEVNFKDLANIMQLSRPRVSQIHKQSLEKIAEKLREKAQLNLSM